MSIRHPVRVTEQYAASFMNERKEHVVEKLFLGEKELESYDCTAGRYSYYSLPRLFPSCVLQVSLYNGDCLNVGIKTDYVINPVNTHREVHSYITNMDECRPLLMRSIARLSSFISIEHSRFLHTVEKDEWETVKSIVRDRDITAFDGYGFQVYSHRVDRCGLEIFTESWDHNIGELNCEHRIALAGVLVDRLNRTKYQRNGIKYAYVREGAFGAKICLYWARIP